MSLIRISRWIYRSSSMSRPRSLSQMGKMRMISRMKWKVRELLDIARQTYSAYTIPGFIDDYEAHYQGAPARKTSSRSQSPSSSTSPLPASDISHDRHGWVDHLAVRYASGQGHSLQKPPMPMDDGDCPLDKHLLERVYTDPFIYIVLLYCKVGFGLNIIECN